MTRPALLGPHARWWARLDPRSRLWLLAAARDSEVPPEVWRACLASADAEALIGTDGWFDAGPTRRLPFPIACYLAVVRGDDRSTDPGTERATPIIHRGPFAATPN